ncbi:MAG: hypothetical protein M3Y03_02320 [Verrucomicrobiota bacterium]|nr:hypothetical protein [Verrucomicrobiota bacterium]
MPIRVSVAEVETAIPSIRAELRVRAQYSRGPLNEAARYCLTKKTNLGKGL